MMYTNVRSKQQKFIFVYRSRLRKTPCFTRQPSMACIRSWRIENRLMLREERPWPLLTLSLGGKMPPSGSFMRPSAVQCFINQCVSQLGLYVIYGIFWGPKIRKDQKFSRSPGPHWGSSQRSPDPLAGPPSQERHSASGLELRPFWLRFAVPPSKNCLKEAMGETTFICSWKQK